MIKEKPSKIALKAKWKIDSPVILKTNAFRAVYTPHSTVLYFGMLDPEDMLSGTQNAKEKEASQTGEKIKEIKTLARYCLDHDELLRLKNEIDKTVEGLIKTGAISAAK